MVSLLFYLVLALMAVSALLRFQAEADHLKLLRQAYNQEASRRYRIKSIHNKGQERRAEYTPLSYDKIA